MVFLMLLGLGFNTALATDASFDNIQLNVKLTRNRYVKSLTFLEPDRAMQGKTMTLHMGLASGNVGGPIATAKVANGSYTFTLKNPVLLRSGVRYAIQTRFTGPAFNAGRPSVLVFTSNERLTRFNTVDNRYFWANF
jgi:hypothetical protein